jgi:hypothetical protein
MTDLIMEEVYAARRHLWERGGGTMHGVCEYLRKRHAERMARQAAGEPQNYQTVERANGQTIKRSNGKMDLARKGEKGE